MYLSGFWKRCIKALDKVVHKYQYYTGKRKDSVEMSHFIADRGN